LWQHVDHQRQPSRYRAVPVFVNVVLPMRVNDVLDRVDRSRRASSIEIRNRIPCNLLHPGLDAIALSKRADLFVHSHKQVVKQVVGIRVARNARPKKRS
jgi:hypothetical protein